MTTDGFNPERTIFSTMLEQSFLLEGGKKYWLSVYDVHPDSHFVWWRVSSAPEFGHGSSAGTPDIDGTWEYAPQGQPVAFSLEGTIIPEPGTIAILSLGLFAFRSRKPTSRAKNFA